MLRICLIVAIVASLAAAAISFTKIQEIITTTRAARDQYHSQFDNEVTAHNKTKKELATTKTDLDNTKKTLAQTKSDLDEAMAKAEDFEKKNASLTTDLAKAQSDRDAAQQELEQWHLIPGGLRPGQVKNLIDELSKTKQARDAVTAENKLLANEYTQLRQQWDSLFGGDRKVILPAGLKGKIVAVDPKYDFVVLDIGSDQGAKERGEMMVDKDGRFLGKIRITSVQKNRSVANILPAWQRGEIEEGDEVLY